jgi:hypothetical protein
MKKIDGNHTADDGRMETRVSREWEGMETDTNHSPLTTLILG